MVVNLRSLSDLKPSLSHPDFSFLNFLEENLVPIKSSCRNGLCGQCRCKSKSNKLTTKCQPLEPLEPDEFLACTTTTSAILGSGIDEIKVVNFFSF